MKSKLALAAAVMVVAIIGNRHAGLHQQKMDDGLAVGLTPSCC
jgi:hypothetical protein